MAIQRTPMVDDDGSGMTGTVINNAWKTELYNQIDAALPVAPTGAWIDVPYNAGYFTGSGGMIWTVPASSVRTYAYLLIGKTMFFFFNISDTNVGGTASISLQIRLPMQARRQTITPIISSNAAPVNVVGYAMTLVDGNDLLCRRLDNSSWTLTGGSNTAVQGTIIVEI